MERCVAWFLRLLDAYDPGRLGAAVAQNQPPEPVRRQVSQRRLRRMKVRRTLAAAAAGATMLLGVALAPPAAAGPSFEVYGRNVVTYSSYPTDPTPTSKWIASAQAERDGLTIRGRGAAQETFGVKRARIYDVLLQELRAGKWVTVASRAKLPDVVNESSRAYAVAYTPAVKTCWWSGQGYESTYRVVNQHGVRRVDDVVANRTTYSKTFTTLMPATDPRCPTGHTANVIFMSHQAYVGDPLTATTSFGYDDHGIAGPAPNLEVRVNWGDGLTVEDAPVGFAPDAATADPNDYLFAAASFPAGEREDDWQLTASEAGTWTSTMGATTSNPKIISLGTDESVTEIIAIPEPPSADVAVEASLVPALSDDRDPADGIQVYAGDTVVYRVKVVNHGPDAASIWVMDHNWPVYVDRVTRAWQEGADPAPYVPGPDPSSAFEWRAPSAAVAETFTFYMEVHATTVEDVLAKGWSYDGPEDISPGFRAGPNSTDDNPPVDPNEDNNAAVDTFRVMPPGWLE
jgi:hypothetical protein